MNPYEAPQSGDAPERRPLVRVILLALLLAAIPVMLLLVMFQRARVAHEQALRAAETAKLQQLKAEAERQ